MNTTSDAAVAVATPVHPWPADGVTADGGIAIRDWQGGPIDCGRCVHHTLRAGGDCEPGRSCMQDAYARRIDRFFHRHRALASRHLSHPYFEVRAIAARYADLFHLHAMLDDPDETVRLQVALRVPQRSLERLRCDPHREVRIRVAMRIEASQLASMRDDPDYQVRATVARRLAEPLLATMADDVDAQVRREVARRIGMPGLLRLAADPAPEVRREVAERLPAGLLDVFDGDTDVIVAHVAAERRMAREGASTDG